MILNSPTCLALRPNGNLLVGVVRGANMWGRGRVRTPRELRPATSLPTRGRTGLRAVDALSCRAHSSSRTACASMIRRYNADTGAFINDFFFDPFRAVSARQRLQRPPARRHLWPREATEGIIELALDGTVADLFTPPELKSMIGVHELPSGNMLVSALLRPVRSESQRPGRRGQAAGPFSAIYRVRHHRCRRRRRGRRFGQLSQHAEPRIRPIATATGLQNACDACPNDPQNDADGDGVCGNTD